ncbi:MAG: flippase-like domain-containing protein [Pseudobutyrivibrio sp.]|nr:flippase-like domain-containing protein [Pseudobutyrivibrio sp.]
MDKSQKKKIFWMCFSLVLSLLTIWAVLRQSEDMSINDLINIVIHADKRWMLLAFLSAGCYIVFEAIAICSILKGLSYKRSLGKGLVYSTSDIYFSAITPSATGGQPASAYFMHRDGIPAGVVSASLVLNLMMYNASIIALGIIAIILAPKAFLGFRLSSKILIVIGFIGLSVLTGFFFVVLKRGDKLFGVAEKLINFLYKKKIIHRVEHKIEKLHKIQNDYDNCAIIMAGQSKILHKAFFWNIIQRASQIIVPTLVYLSLGGEKISSKVLFSKQCLITIGYNYVPIPGAMGISDFLMIDGFSKLMTRAQAFQLDMISRGITFYICVAVSGIVTLVGYLIGRKKK